MGTREPLPNGRGPQLYWGAPGWAGCSLFLPKVPCLGLTSRVRVAPVGGTLLRGHLPICNTHRVCLGPSRLRERREEGRGPQCPSSILAVTPQPALTKSQRLSLRLQVLSQLFIQEQSGLTRGGGPGSTGTASDRPWGPSVAVLGAFLMPPCVRMAKLGTWSRVPCLPGFLIQPVT